MTPTNLPTPAPSKRTLGRTAIENTPITTRSRVPLGPDARRKLEARLRRTLAPFATRIERATLRFEDVNGPRGGVDTRCAVKVVLSGADSIIVEEQASGVRESVGRVLPRVARAVRRAADQSGKKAPRATANRRAGRERPAAARPRRREQTDPGSLIGHRVGQGQANLAAALERPEKVRRDALVDTALADTSATDRKAGGTSTARRNSKKNDAGMVHALEDSRGKPSRKSTRGGKNRVQAATQLTRRARRKTLSPQSRAARGA